MIKTDMINNRKIRRIKVFSKQKIGEGAYGTVYRISPRRVVKIFDISLAIEEQMEACLDEIEGSQIYAYALPVLGIAEVTLRKRNYIGPSDYKIKKFTGYGVIKKYLPYQAKEHEIKTLYQQRNYDGKWYWDDHPYNYRKDNRGNIYLVDTGL